VVFTLGKLKPTGGSLYGHVFENKATGLPRDLYWSLTIDFAELEMNGETWTPSLTAEWIVWPARRWVDLDGLGLADVRKPKLTEASFYGFGEHQQGDLRALNLTRGRGPAFKAQVELVLDLVDDHGRRHRGVRIEATSRIVFDGIYVLPDNLSPRPDSAKKAQAVVAKFLEPDTLEPPVWDRFRYVLAPKT